MILFLRFLHVFLILWSLLGESNGADKLLWTPVSLLLGGQHVDVVSDQELSHLKICLQYHQKMQENVSLFTPVTVPPQVGTKLAGPKSGAHFSSFN